MVDSRVSLLFIRVVISEGDLLFIFSYLLSMSSFFLSISIFSTLPLQNGQFALQASFTVFELGHLIIGGLTVALLLG